MFNEAGVMGADGHQPSWIPPSSLFSPFPPPSNIYRIDTQPERLILWVGHIARGGEIKLNKLTVKKDWPMKMGVCCSHLSLATCGM